jgi:alkanesulfonate monooxygenase SsuD/methylene tetrahydromethanopterin reductase-like flavin-dependent oxidoreductase (luciferase family)
MRFGLFGGATAKPTGETTDSRLYADFIDYVCEAEALGFHSVFLVEHHFTGMAQVSASLGLLTYLAGRTSRIRLGTAVTVLTWHNPVLLAEQAATLDLVSGGRFDFGIGRGYRQNEFRGFCIPIEEANERYDEALLVLRKAWASRERFSHHGKYWHFENIVVEPEPTQKPHPPFWIGAGSPAGIAAAAANGFNLLLDQLAPFETIGERVAAFHRAAAAQGQAVRPHSIGVARALHLTMNDREREEAHRMRADFLLTVQALAGGAGSSLALPTSFADTRAASEKAALIGPPDEIVRRLRMLEAMGVDYVLLLDVSGSREALRTFAREVMPAFAGSTLTAAL